MSADIETGLTININVRENAEIHYFTKEIT